MPLLAWAAILLVAGFILQAVVMKQQKQKPPALDDFDVPQIDEGTPHAVVFGDAWLEGWQVLWYGNYRTKKVKSKTKK